MKLTYFDNEPNFGDELNLYLWPRLLPAGFLDDDESELFVGIGSILYDHWPAKPIKHVVGSGYAAYTPPPNMNDGTWNTLFVRGPRTARELGLPPESAVCDAAIMLRGTELPLGKGRPVPVAFMPHYDSLNRGNWPEVCRLAGITMIDPTLPCEEVLSQLRDVELLITEAMHGAIVADALRIPWIAVEPILAAHRGKWFDWAESLELEYRPQRLWPSNSREIWTFMTGAKARGRASRVLGGTPTYPVNRIATHVAARGLQSLAQQEPQLSSDAAIDRVTDRSLSLVANFVRDRRKAA